ncbi:MAG TPA: ABC transporter substrate-binding protein [Anaerolineales bacterium]|nr:ABC transporter substrate-binding protein [Anaerolineales bacterium]
MCLKKLVLALLLIGLAACNQVNKSSLIPTSQLAIQTGVAIPSETPLPSSQATSTPTPTPARLLSICLVNEPRSLFLYDAVSSSEKSVLEAIYDGPIDIKDFIASPVILEKMPSLANGDAVLQSVSVAPGNLLVDARGILTSLADGVIYRPSGCTELACSQTFAGRDPVQMDQLIVHFKLLPGILWSDGTPLTSADSVYSYEVARNLNLAVLPEQVSYTSSYKALDELTVEWIGLPGFMDGQYQTKFFSPLPQHAWANIPVNELPSNEVSSEKPLGWGPYVIDEWVPGDHISLYANPHYFREAEGLPHFGNLVFRFVADNNEALSAVLAGECDLVDQSAGLETQVTALLQLQDKGNIYLAFQTASAWDLLEFDISPLNANRPAYFGTRQVRQAVALCIDRQALVEKLSAGQMQVADMYVPSSHPLYNPEAKRYVFDRRAGEDLLHAAGWVDNDNNSSTPRIAQGVRGVEDGTAFSIQYLISDDAEHQAAAQQIQADLNQCGIQVNINPQPAQQFLASGPDGPVFGRTFDLAQFAWMTANEPPCSFYLSTEIPGLYPDYPKGWGGVNAGGYNNPSYDQACLDAIHSLPDMLQHQQKHAEAQAIFAEDLPSLPLYWHYRVIVGRPDLCGLPQGSVTESIFSGLELFNYGEGCP